MADWLRIGDVVINLDQVTHVDLSAETTIDEVAESCVDVNTTDGSLNRFFGNEATAIRMWFAGSHPGTLRKVTELCREDAQ